MSGDESDHFDGHRRYVVKKLNWRSKAVTDALRVLDALALVSHWTSDGRPMPGKFPHVRTHSEEVENRDPVRNLLRNFYREDWLETLDKYELRELNMGKEINLVFPNRLLRCVAISLCRHIIEFCSSLAFRYKNVSDPQRPPLPVGSAQATASEPHAMRASRRRPDSKLSNSKHRGARKANFQKRDGNGMDVD